MLHALPPGTAWRRLALWLRKPLKSALGPWVDVEVWGLKLRLRGRGNLSEQRLIFMPQFLDAAERLAIAEALKDGGVFFDIGANAGVYALWVASRRVVGTRVVAFEPDPDLCASLRFNLHTNGLDAVQLHSLALGREEGRVTLVAGEGNKGENRIEASPAAAGVAVDLTTLPRFLARAGIERIDAMKIDIEGHEPDVLEPLFAEVPRQLWPRLLVCEVVHDTGNRLAHLLAETGYRLVQQGRLNGIYRLDP
jgi:FkbM family methyltransferase